MSFGLTNIPATFQALINTVLKPFLMRFMLVFFDDILVYNSLLDLHLQLLREILKALRRNQLFIKRTMC
jgi:hypothetical protein